MSIADLLKVTSSPITLYEGIIARDVASASDLAEVIIPAFDPEKIFAEAPWMPRTDTALPPEGSRCVVGMGETEEPGTPEAWILAWWPYD